MSQNPVSGGSSTNFGAPSTVAPVGGAGGLTPPIGLGSMAWGVVAAILTLVALGNNHSRNVGDFLGGMSLVLLILWLPLIMWNLPWRRRARYLENLAIARRRQEEMDRLIERNYRMEIELGWRPDTGYDRASEASRFSSGGAFNGMPRPAIWQYSDALGGPPIRTVGGAVGPQNRRYGPLTPQQWGSVAAVAAWGMSHHRHHR